MDHQLQNAPIPKLKLRLCQPWMQEQHLALANHVYRAAWQPVARTRAYLGGHGRHSRYLLFILIILLVIHPLTAIGHECLPASFYKITTCSSPAMPPYRGPCNTYTEEGVCLCPPPSRHRGRGPSDALMVEPLTGPTCGRLTPKLHSSTRLHGNAQNTCVQAWPMSSQYDPGSNGSSWGGDKA